MGLDEPIESLLANRYQAATEVGMRLGSATINSIDVVETGVAQPMNRLSASPGIRNKRNTFLSQAFLDEVSEIRGGPICTGLGVS